MTEPTATTVVAGAPPPSPPLPLPPSPLQPGQSQAFSVGFEFVIDDAFDPDKGAAEQAIADRVGVSKADVTITVTDAPDFEVTVSIYAADAAKAQSVAASLNALNEDQLSKIEAKGEVEAEIRKWETLGDVDIGKKIKNLKKKLKQIDELEQKLKAGASLNEDQQGKIDAKAEVMEELKTLEALA